MNHTIKRLEHEIFREKYNDQEDIATAIAQRDLKMTMREAHRDPDTPEQKVCDTNIAIGKVRDDYLAIWARLEEQYRQEIYKNTVDKNLDIASEEEHQELVILALKHIKKNVPNHKDITKFMEGYR